jgi:hypothetical protein
LTSGPFSVFNKGMGSKPIRWRRVEWGALGALLGIRLLALHSFGQSDWAVHPMVDAAVYWGQAQELAEGGAPFEEGYYQPPGYPWFLSLLIGIAGEASLDFIRWVQLGLGMFSCWALMILGRWLGEPRSAPWMGVVAGTIYGLYPRTILFEHDLLTPSLSTALLLASLLLLWPGRGLSKGTVFAGLAGLLLGFSVVVHPTWLLAALVILGAVALAGRRETRLGPILALATGMGLALLPTSHTNHQEFGKFELVSHNSGLNFYLGNGAEWRETRALEAGLPFRRLVLQAEPHRRNLAERNAWWWARSRQEISADPMAWSGALWTKAIWSINGAEIPRNEDYRCRMESDDPLHWLPLLPVRFSWVFGLACLGALVAWRARGRLRLGVLLWLALHLPMVFFLVADRYRMASWAVVALLASLGLSELMRLKDQWGAGWRPGWKISGLLVCLVLPFVPIGEAGELDPSDCRYQDGHLALMEERYEEAEAYYREVLLEEPDHMSAHFWLAELLRRSGRLEEAAEHLEPVLEWFPQYFKGQRILGQIYLELELLDPAIEATEAAYRVPGERDSTGRELIRLLLRSGQKERAAGLMQEDHELAVKKGLKAVIPSANFSGRIEQCRAVVEADSEGVPRRATVIDCPDHIRKRVEETAMKFRFHPALDSERGEPMEATWRVKVPLEIR